jgi:hypothetical protein
MLPGSGSLATIPKNGDDLAWPGKGTRAVAYPYISKTVARIVIFRDAVAFWELPVDALTPNHKG